MYGVLQGYGHLVLPVEMPLEEGAGGREAGHYHVDCAPGGPSQRGRDVLVSTWRPIGEDGILQRPHTLTLASL